jgi:hypothetical protein
LKIDVNVRRKKIITKIIFFYLNLKATEGKRRSRTLIRSNNNGSGQDPGSPESNGYYDSGSGTEIHTVV